MTGTRRHAPRPTRLLASAGAVLVVACLAACDGGDDTAADPTPPATASAAATADPAADFCAAYAEVADELTVAVHASTASPTHTPTPTATASAALQAAAEHRMGLANDVVLVDAPRDAPADVQRAWVSVQTYFRSTAQPLRGVDFSDGGDVDAGQQALGLSDQLAAEALPDVAEDLPALRTWAAGHC